MLYSIDYHKGMLSGWVATDDVNTTIKVIDSVGNEYFTYLNVSRRSVVERGITDNLNCGFTFKDILPANIYGNFYSVIIFTREKDISTTKYCGVVSRARDEFERFQIKDRQDFSCQEKNTSNLFSTNSDLIAFKLLMIRLRRGKRAYSWRGEFKGHSYPYINQDWVFFKEFFIRGCSR